MGERVFKSNMPCSLENSGPCVVLRFVLAQHELSKAVLLGSLYTGNAAHLPLPCHGGLGSEDLPVSGVGLHMTLLTWQPASKIRLGTVSSNKW